MADEWLEICGVPGTDLSGWTLEGASSVPLTLPAAATIGPSGAYLVANYAEDDAKSALAVSPDLVTTAVALSNSSLFVTLHDATGAIVDVAGASGTPPFAGTSGDAKASMERLDAALDGGLAASWTSAATAVGFDAGAVSFGTPGVCGGAADPEPAAPTPSSTSSHVAETPAPPPPAADAPASAVRVSEIYPSPDSGEREWIELTNPSNVGEILDEWTVEDARGTKTPLSGLLLPWARFVILSPKGSLNNDGDVVILRDARGRAVDRVEYPKTRRGDAYMRVELQDAFATTSAPTPGSPNVLVTAEIPAPDAEPSMPVIAPPTPVVAAAAPVIRAEPAPTIVPAAKNAPAKRSAAKARSVASKYKGSAYVATIVAPPGVYSKTRAYVQRDGAIEELRLSKSPSMAWSVGDRISFIAQRKSEGAVSFLLANPNSVRTIGSASATFATSESWPGAAGAYAFTAEVASIRGDALEVTLGGVEGDVLAPSGSASALKPGDTVRVEGFVAPGPRPRVILPYAHALRLMKPHAALDEASSLAPMRPPGLLAAGLTLIAGAVGLAAYLRMQRLKRLALLQAPIEDDAWERP